MLEKLSKSEIIDLIGEDLYEQITDFLDAVNAGADEEGELQIYIRRNMVRLLLSFASSTDLMKPKFWKKMLDTLSDAERSELALNYSITSGMPGEQLVNNCLKFEFKKYELNTDSIASSGEKRKEIETCVAPAFPYKSLKNYQVEIFNQAIEQTRIPRNRFIIQMPTGSGKTRTAMEVVVAHLNDRSVSGDVLWLAHSVDLVDQAADSFYELWTHVGGFDADVRIVDGARKGLDAEGENVAFVTSTFQSMISITNAGTDGASSIENRFSLIVVDEAHMSLAPTYRALIQRLLSGGSVLVGLTATPGRDTDDEAENARLAEFYFQNIVGLVAPEHTTVFDYLKSIGIMSRTKLEALKGADIQLTDKQLEEIQDHFSVPKTVLEKLGKDQLRNIEIVVRLKRLMNEQPNCQVILFACSVDHSKFLVSVLNYLGMSAAHIDGSTSASRRHSLLNNFRDQNLQILSNYGVLSTGFDAPKTDVVFIARPTASIVLYSQMIGRGLRGPAIGGTRSCLVINVKDNLIGLPDPDEIYDYFAMYYD